MRAQVSLVGLLISGLFLFDRLLKHLVTSLAAQVGGDFFSLTRQANTAGPFSLPLPQLVFMAMAALVLVWLVSLAYDAVRQRAVGRLLGVGLMIIGGFSNLWDRLTQGGVVDIWHLAIGTGLSFNLSDVYLLLGLVLVVWSYRQRAGRPTRI